MNIFKSFKDYTAGIDTTSSVITEKLARGLKPLLKLGTTITKKDGEDVLLDLSDKFDDLGDEGADNIASWLNMAIELMQDGYAGDATKKLKQFNKACKDVLNGKEVGSAFESTVTEAKTSALNVQDERHFGKKGIIIMIDDNGVVTSAIFKDKKNADKYDRNNMKDLEALLKLAKDTKYPAAIDEQLTELNEANGQTVKEFGDLLALLLDEDSGMDIERAINAMDPKKARVLEKQISTLYKRLFDLTNQGFDLREDNSLTNEAFSRMSSDKIETELYAASQALTTYYDWLKAGNDSGKGESIDHVISLLKKCKSDIKRFKDKEETIGTAYEAPVVETNEAKTLSIGKIGMMGAKILNKIKIGTIFDTKNGQYEVTGFGQQANAFKEFEAMIDGKEVKVKLTAMYGVKLEVTDDVRSARYNKEEELNSIILESVNEGKFDGIADLVKALHFETDPKTAEEKKIAIGKSQGEYTKKKQIEGGEYSLRRFRKEIKFGDGTYLGVFLPGSYDAATSTLGDGPHKKAVKKIKWNQKKYDQWLEDMAANGGADNAFDMAQNAKNEPGLIDWVKKEFRGDDALQRIQWDIEGYAESVVTEKVEKIACLECDEVNTKKAWNKNNGFCPSCKDSSKGVAESVMSELDIIRQESDSMSDFISNVYKTPGFKHFKGDKSFKGFLELTYDYTNQEAELTEANEINEGAIDLLADDIEDAKTYDAVSDGNSVQARSTKKTWDDGVPVLKYIARAPKKSVKLPKKFKVVDDTKYGWWYLQISGVWYGIEQEDYGTPPFEY